MSVYESSDLITLKCAASVPFAQFVQMNAAGGDLHCKTADDQSPGLVGVSAEAVELLAGQTGNLGVVISGVAKVTSSGTIAVGDSVATDANGLAESATAGSRRLGIALQSAVSGDVFSLLLQPGQLIA